MAIKTVKTISIQVEIRWAIKVTRQKQNLHRWLISTKDEFIDSWWWFDWKWQVPRFDSHCWQDLVVKSWGFTTAKRQRWKSELILSIWGLWERYWAQGYHLRQTGRRLLFGHGSQLGRKPWKDKKAFRFIRSQRIWLVWGQTGEEWGIGRDTCW